MIAPGTPPIPVHGGGDFRLVFLDPDVGHVEVITADQINK
jgi:hypothetical protein